MSDIRLAFSFKNHRKRKKANKLLKLEPSATDYLIDLWIATAENHPDGILHGMDETDIALEAGWNGEPREFVKALKTAGWLDNSKGVYRLHDWGDHQRWIIHRPQRVERARKAALAKHAKDKENKESKTRGSANRMLSASDKHATEHAPSPSPSPSPTPKDKKPTSGRPPHFSKAYQGEIIKKLEAAAKSLLIEFPEVFKFIQFNCKAKVHPGALCYVLEEMKKKNDIDDYWAFGIKLVKKYDWNFKDADRIEEGEKDKINFNKMVKAIENAMVLGGKSLAI
jgi:hypothetical protein